jgi:hypothetical protein
MARSCPTSLPGLRSCSLVPVSPRLRIYPILSSILNVIFFSCLLAGIPGTKAVNSLVFAEYLNRVLWNATRSDDAPSEVIPHWVINTTAVAAVIFVFILVVGTRSLGPRAAVILTSMKVRNFETVIPPTVLSSFIKVLALVRPQDGRLSCSLI